MWKEIKDLVLKKNGIFYGIEYKNDDHQITTQFNNYFVNSIKSIEDVQYINNLPMITNRFQSRAITTQEIKKIR